MFWLDLHRHVLFLSSILQVNTDLYRSVCNLSRRHVGLQLHDRQLNSLLGSHRDVYQHLFRQRRKLWPLNPHLCAASDGTLKYHNPIKYLCYVLALDLICIFHKTFDQSNIAEKRLHPIEIDRRRSDQTEGPGGYVIQFRNRST